MAGEAPLNRILSEEDILAIFDKGKKLLWHLFMPTVTNNNQSVIDVIVSMGMFISFENYL